MASRVSWQTTRAAAQHGGFAARSEEGVKRNHSLAAARLTMSLEAAAYGGERAQNKGQAAGVIKDHDRVGDR